LEELGFNGTVFVPEPEGYTPNDSYEHQISWEWEALNQATVAVFWVPRHLESFPAFTTNVEFGLLVASGKAVLGFPDGAPKMRYLDKPGQRFHLVAQTTLRATLVEAVRLTRILFGEH
jgi:hypothetical protein